MLNGRWIYDAIGRQRRCERGCYSQFAKSHHKAVHFLFDISYYCGPDRTYDLQAIPVVALYILIPQRSNAG